MVWSSIRTIVVCQPFAALLLHDVGVVQGIAADLQDQRFSVRHALMMAPPCALHRCSLGQNLTQRVASLNMAGVQLLATLTGRGSCPGPAGASLAGAGALATAGAGAGAPRTL